MKFWKLLTAVLFAGVAVTFTACDDSSSSEDHHDDGYATLTVYVGDSCKGQGTISVWIGNNRYSGVGGSVIRQQVQVGTTVGVALQSSNGHYQSTSVTMSSSGNSVTLGCYD